MKNVFNSVARVEQLAVSHNMSVSRLAIDSGINPSTIATAKSRGCQLNLDTIIRICDHLDMPDGILPGTGLYGSDLQPFSNKHRNTNGRKKTPLQMKQYLRCNSYFSYRFAFTSSFQKCCLFSFSSVAFFRSPFYNCLNRIFILFRILMPRKMIETGGVSYREVFSP